MPYGQLLALRDELLGLRGVLDEPTRTLLDVLVRDIDRAIAEEIDELTASRMARRLEPLRDVLVRLSRRS